MRIIHSDLVLFPGVAVNVYPGSTIYNDLQDILDSVVGIQVQNSLYGCLVLLEKKNRFYFLRGTKRFKIIDSQIVIIQDDIDEEDVEFNKISGIFKGKMSEFGKLLKQVAPDLGLELENIVKEKSGLEILFVFVFLMDYSKEQKLEILENEDLKEILEIGIKWVDESLLNFKISIQKIKKRQEKASNSQNDVTEVEELKEKITKLNIPKSSLKSVEKDLKRMARMNSNNADYHVIFSYLEVVADLPWDRCTQDRNISVEEAKEILDQDHQGLDKVKNRILEYIAVLGLTKTLKGPILCLVGPPGTGKTSLGKSIARALGRKFFRIALGGVRDEAQIRGHRRTYIGALPGLLIQAFRKVGVNNPVFLLDEIDKLGTDGRSDPTSALLEVLDPEQNQSFTDSYLNLAFDLSKTVFIATANDLSQIPDPLRDRMEIIKIPSYTMQEKISIAKSHLISKQLLMHGLKTEYQSEFQPDLLQHIIETYTREAGVREFERHIAALCRYIAIGSKSEKSELKKDMLEKILGPPLYQNLDRTNKKTVGLATGLAWTPTGGKVLYIECTSMRGMGKLVLTGNLKETMKESAQIALSWIKSNSTVLQISKFPFEMYDFHIHVPSGGISKDGPSAGITILSSILSHILKKPIIPNLAMTGEITLLGEILPVGGIRDKVLAAKSMKISNLILPKSNQADYDQLGLHDVSVTFVDNVVKTLTAENFHALAKMNGSMGDKKIRINEPAPVSFSPYQGQLSNMGMKIRKSIAEGYKTSCKTVENSTSVTSHLKRKR